MTREEAIKFYADEILLLELAPTINGDNGSSMKEEWKRQADIHRLAIAALREQPRWIPVTERLPERGEKVLCYMNFFDKDETIQWGTCITENRYDGVLVGSNPKKYVWEWQGDFVTHWMPLPEPPKEEV